MTAYNPDLDFNFEDDSKLPGLVPGGVYHGNVTAVSYDPEKYCVVWAVTLADNGGLCTDDETPIDGQTLRFNNWLPKPGDENEQTSSGRSTKRQAKINMLAEFIKRMQFVETTAGEFLEAVSNAEYIGREVEVVVGNREYQGSVFNEIQKMYVPVDATF